MIPWSIAELDQIIADFNANPLHWNLRDISPTFDDFSYHYALRIRHEATAYLNDNHEHNAVFVPDSRLFAFNSRVQLSYKRRIILGFLNYQRLRLLEP